MGTNLSHSRCVFHRIPAHFLTRDVCAIITVRARRWQNWHLCSFPAPQPSLTRDYDKNTFLQGCALLYSFRWWWTLPSEYRSFVRSWWRCLVCLIATCQHRAPLLLSSMAESTANKRCRTTAVAQLGWERKSVVHKANCMSLLLYFWCDQFQLWAILCIW